MSSICPMTLTCAGVEPDLLLRLTQRRERQVRVGRVHRATGKRHLAPVRLHAVGALGEDDMQLAAVEVQRHEHGGAVASFVLQQARRVGGQAVPYLVDHASIMTDAVRSWQIAIETFKLPRMYKEVVAALLAVVLLTACGGDDAKPARYRHPSRRLPQAAVPTQPPAPTVCSDTSPSAYGNAGSCRPRRQPARAAPSRRANWRAFVVGIMGLSSPGGDKAAVCRPMIDPPPTRASVALTQARAPVAPTEGPQPAQVTPGPGQQPDFARLKAISSKSAPGSASGSFGARLPDSVANVRLTSWHTALKAPRGVTDILPADQPYWRLVRETAVRVAESFGYGQIETPVFEHAGLFLRPDAEGTDVVDKEVYLFEDRGGDDLVLRPGGHRRRRPRLPRARHGVRAAAGAPLLHRPASSATTAPRPAATASTTSSASRRSARRARTIDAEVIDLLRTFYDALGLRDYTLQLNSIGDGICRPAYIEKLRAYYADKLDQHVRRLPAPLRRQPAAPARLQERAAASRSRPARPASSTTSASRARRTSTALRSASSTTSASSTRSTRMLVRGLDYYTRTAFEFQPKVEGAQSTLGGGGRYDGLIEQLGGRPTPAIGFGTGLERIILNLKRQELDSAPAAAPTPSSPSADEAAAGAAMQLAHELRVAGLNAIARFAGTQPEGADAPCLGVDARFAAIIGAQELADGSVTSAQPRNVGAAEGAAGPGGCSPAKLTSYPAQRYFKRAGGASPQPCIPEGDNRDGPVRQAGADNAALRARRTLGNNDKRFELMDLMEMYSKEAILELTASADGEFWTTRRPTCSASSRCRCSTPSPTCGCPRMPGSGSARRRRAAITPVRASRLWAWQRIARAHRDADRPAQLRLLLHQDPLMEQISFRRRRPDTSFRRRRQADRTRAARRATAGLLCCSFCTRRHTMVCNAVVSKLNSQQRRQDHGPFDKLALSMRRYEPMRTQRSHSDRFELMDLMEMYSKQSILELNTSADGKKWSRLTPDADRKFKVSLLDSISELSLPADAWFSVGQTAPSGDYSKARIEAHGRGNEALGQIEMLIGRRNYAYYFTEDPVLSEIDSHTARQPRLLHRCDCKAPTEAAPPRRRQRRNASASIQKKRPGDCSPGLFALLRNVSCRRPALPP